MNSKFKISIPKPCHENWNKMTPNEKGKFCSSCSKTVVDFTKKSTKEIQEYLIDNKNNRVCGHFYKKQLDSIVIEIPSTTFQQQLSFQKLFILALFFVMGTTLFSCQYENGKKQKIENVIIKDSIQIIEDELGFIVPTKDKLDRNNPKTTYCHPIQDTIEETIVLGELPDLTVEGDIDFTEIKEVGVVEISEKEDEVVFGSIANEEYPRFKEAKNLSHSEVKKDFNKRINLFISENFNFELTQHLGLSNGKYRIFIRFIIDKKGITKDVKVRAPHLTLKKEVEKMLTKLPQFIPGKQDGKVVETRYNIPITFVVE